MGIALLFLIGLLMGALKWWLGMAIVILLLAGLYRKNPETRFVNALYMVFLISFAFFQVVNGLVAETAIQREWRVMFNRCSLTIIIAGLYMTHLLYRQPVSFFHQKPNWHAQLKLPGRVIPIFHFWITGLIVNAAVYIPLIVLQRAEKVRALLLFALLFSLINAVVEELLWRGPLFSSLLRHTSVPYAFTVTSFGFGLLHLAIGIPLVISLLFSFAGSFYGLIVYKTNSIYPSILFHFVLNIGMVLSGWILS